MWNCFVIFFSFSGGCKQKKMRSDVFVRKSDLICFSYCGRSRVRCRPSCQLSGNKVIIYCTSISHNQYSPLCFYPTVGIRYYRKDCTRVSQWSRCRVWSHGHRCWESHQILMLFQKDSLKFLFYFENNFNDKPQLFLLLYLCAYLSWNELWHLNVSLILWTSDKAP